MDPELVKTLMYGAFMVYAASELGSFVGEYTADLRMEYEKRKANGNGNGNGTSNGNGKRNGSPKA